MTRPGERSARAWWYHRKGVSPKALILARSIDRLPPGDYTVELHKGLPPQLDYVIKDKRTGGK